MNHLTTSIILFLIITVHTAAGQDSTGAHVTSRSPFAFGTYMLAGSFSLNKSSYPSDGITMTTLTAAPSLLFFTSRQIAVGAQFAYTTVYSKHRFSENTVSMTSFGPLLRFYPFNSDPLLFLFAGVSVKNTYNRSDTFPAYTASTQSAHAGFGFDIMNGSMLAIEPFIEYTWYNLEESSDSNGLTFGVSIVSFHP